MRNLLILAVSLYLVFEQVQLSACFCFDANRCRTPNNAGGRSTRNYHHLLHDKNDSIQLNLQQTHNAGDEGEAKAIHRIPVHNRLSSPPTMPIALVIFPLLLLLLPQSASALAMNNLLDNIHHLEIPVITNGPDPRYFLAGGICAAVSHGITTPIDVVKTRIQSDPQKYNGIGIVEASKTILNEDGYGALLKGFGPTVIGYGLEGGAKFGLYETLKPEIVGLLNLDTPNIAYIIASVVAGGVASIILCPLERTRIRLVTDPDFSEYNVLTGIPRLVEESGVVSLFYGLPAMLSKQCPYTLGKQVTYDAICRALYSIVTNANDASTKVEVSLVGACCASVIACVLSQPGDVILTETYKDKSGPSSSRSFPQVVSTIYNERQGVNGFYAGIIARLIQVGGIITSQLLLYDYIKQNLGLPATGSS